MKAEEAASDLERLRALFAAERSANFPEFTDVYCVDAADDVLARFARARRGDPHAALQFLKEDYAWRKAEDAASLRSTPPADVLGQDPAVLAEYYRRRCVGLDCKGRLTFYQAYACCKNSRPSCRSRTSSNITPGSRNAHVRCSTPSRAQIEATAPWLLFWTSPG